MVTQFVTFPPTVPSSAIDYLSFIRDPTNGATLYTFEHGNYEYDPGFRRSSQSYALPGSDAPFDPFGSLGFPLDKRTVTVKFTKRYRLLGGTPETHSAARIAFHRAVASGAQVQLVMLDSAGAEWIALGKPVNVPPTIKGESVFSMDLEVGFELNPPIFRQLVPPNWFFFDTPGFYFDGTPGVDGFTFDANTMPTLALTAQSQSFTITNTGDATDFYGTITVGGPYPPFDLQIFSPTSTLRHWMSWYVALGSTDVLQINLGPGTVYLNGVPAFDQRFAYRGGLFGGVWPGDNVVAVYGIPSATYDLAHANGLAVFDYRNARY